MRLLKGIIFVVLGLVCVTGAMFVPGYIRAVDAAVIERAGEGTLTVLGVAQDELRMQRFGTAGLLGEAAAILNVPGAPEFLRQVDAATAADPNARRWGEPAPIVPGILGTALPAKSAGDGLLDEILPENSRAALLAWLQRSQRPYVQEVLKNRSLQQTVVFPPVASPSGQALDAAILLTGLLLETDQCTPSFRKDVETYAAAANRGFDSSPIEILYLNLNSLARRLNWEQLTTLLKQVDSAQGLRELVRVSTRADRNLPVVFASVITTGTSVPIVDFLRRYPQGGVRSLEVALHAGTGGIRELIRRGQPVHEVPLRAWLMWVPGVAAAARSLASLALFTSWLALLLKYLFWFDGAFCLARGFWYLRREPTRVERPLEVRGIGTLRQQTAAALVVALAVALGEPYLAQNRLPVTQATIWHFPKINPPLLAQTANLIKPMSNQSNWLALAVFFSVQLAIYVIGLIKLREIKRQAIPSALKLKVLDNEENLFDTGLYIGLGGTGLSLVLMALDLFSASPMIAYASTGFGVFFASVLKIVHVRSYRRLLILQAADESAQPVP